VRYGFAEHTLPRIIFGAFFLFSSNTRISEIHPTFFPMPDARCPMPKNPIEFSPDLEANGLKMEAEHSYPDLKLMA
jgi:hypothetical protein